MSPPRSPTRRHFTDAARAAALEARRRKKEVAIPREAPEVFVVRLPGAGLQFGWEIRRFGALVLHRSCTDYPTRHDAYAAGHEALSGQGAGA